MINNNEIYFLPFRYNPLRFAAWQFLYHQPPLNKALQSAESISLSEPFALKNIPLELPKALPTCIYETSILIGFFIIFNCRDQHHNK